MTNKSAFFQSENQQNILSLLTDSLNHVLNTCVFGASNKMTDIQKTNGWVIFHDYRYHKQGKYLKQDPNQLTRADKTDFFFDSDNPGQLFINRNRRWFYHCQDYASVDNVDIRLAEKFSNENPLFDPSFCLNDNHRKLLTLAMLVQQKRQGNCSERCCLIAKYLWEKNNKNIKKIEIINFNFDHCILIVNRAGDLKDPNSWGNAFIVDSWFPEKGSIYSAAEFMQKAKEAREFVIKNAGELNKIGFKMTVDNSTADISWHIRNEIIPEKNKYPTYSTSPFYPVDYYYELLNVHTADLLKNEDDFDLPTSDRVDHETKFQASLAQIRNRIS